MVVTIILLIDLHMKTVTSMVSVILLVTETNTYCVLCARHCARGREYHPQGVQSLGPWQFN